MSGRGTVLHALGALAAAALCAGAAPARAGGAAAALSCSVAATGINFGIYDPLAALADASTGSLRVTCMGPPGQARQLAFQVSLDAGLSGRFAMRTMRSGANVLAYNIYWDPQHTAIAGDGSGGSQTGTLGPIVTDRGLSASATATLYGLVPAGQDPLAGSYGDVLTVTVSY